MKKRNLFLLGMLVMALAFGLFLSGCATSGGFSLPAGSNGVTTNKGTSFDRKRMHLTDMPNYTVLGPVTLEKDWHGILGFSTPEVGRISGIDIFYVFQWGGVTYVDLLAEARRRYPDADAVIDINIDKSRSNFFIFYARRTNIVSGIAIKYSRDEVGYSPPEKGIVQSVIEDVVSDH